MLCYLYTDGNRAKQVSGYIGQDRIELLDFLIRQFEEWSGEVADRADDVFKNDKKDGPIKDREKRIKEMDEVIKKDLE